MIPPRCLYWATSGRKTGVSSWSTQTLVLGREKRRLLMLMAFGPRTSISAAVLPAPIEASMPCCRRAFRRMCVAWHRSASKRVVSRKRSKTAKSSAQVVWNTWVCAPDSRKRKGLVFSGIVISKSRFASFNSRLICCKTWWKTALKTMSAQLSPGWLPLLVTMHCPWDDRWPRWNQVSVRPSRRYDCWGLVAPMVP